MINPADVTHLTYPITAALPSIIIARNIAARIVPKQMLSAIPAKSTSV